MIVNDILLKLDALGLHFCCRKFSYIFNHFYTVSYRVWWNDAK